MSIIHHHGLRAKEPWHCVERPWFLYTVLKKTKINFIENILTIGTKYKFEKLSYVIYETYSWEHDV